MKFTDKNKFIVMTESKSHGIKDWKIDIIIIVIKIKHQKPRMCLVPCKSALGQPDAFLTLAFRVLTIQSL